MENESEKEQDYTKDFSCEKEDINYQFDKDPNNNYEPEQTEFCNNYGSTHVYNKKCRSIMKDLQKYPLEDSIKSGADIIYNKMIPIVRRGKRRNSLLFYCVSCAYKEAGRVFNPFEIGAMFGLDSSDVQKTDSIFSETKTGYRAPSIVYSPLDFVVFFGKQLNLTEETCNEVLIKGKYILEKCPEILQHAPQVIAAGILDYYAGINGISVADSHIFSHFAGRSAVTTDKIRKLICAVDNS